MTKRKSDPQPVLEPHSVIEAANYAHQQVVEASKRWRHEKQKIIDRCQRNHYDETTTRHLIETGWDINDATSERRYHTEEANRQDLLVIREKMRELVEIEKGRLEVERESLEVQRGISNKLDLILAGQNTPVVPRARSEIHTQYR